MEWSLKKFFKKNTIISLSAEATVYEYNFRCHFTLGPLFDSDNRISEGTNTAGFFYFFFFIENLVDLMETKLTIMEFESDFFFFCSRIQWWSILSHALISVLFFFFLWDSRQTWYWKHCHNRKKAFGRYNNRPKIQCTEKLLQRTGSIVLYWPTILSCRIRITIVLQYESTRWQCLSR